jgi:hypothetical protein
MSPQYSGEWHLLFSTALLVGMGILLFKQFWNEPLNHGSGFFLEVEVPPGFYEGEGVGWLKRYRTTLLVALSIEALALLAIPVAERWLLFPWWVLLPLWAWGASVLGIAAAWGFAAYTRATLGANPPVRPSFAIPLETRRLGDYISWPLEALLAVITAFSWALLLVNGNAQFDWKVPVLVTYAVIGLFPLKIGIVRNSFPIPAERPEDHYRWMEAKRRLSLHAMDILRWGFLFMLVDYATLHGWHPATEGAWLRWLRTGVATAVCLFVFLTLIREKRRVTSMGRGLRPVGSWSTPFRPASLVEPGFAPAAVWFGGLVLLIVFFLR